MTVIGPGAHSPPQRRQPTPPAATSAPGCRRATVAAARLSAPPPAYAPPAALSRQRPPPFCPRPSAARQCRAPARAAKPPPPHPDTGAAQALSAAPWVAYMGRVEPEEAPVRRCFGRLPFLVRVRRLRSPHRPRHPERQECLPGRRYQNWLPQPREYLGGGAMARRCSCGVKESTVRDCL